MNKLETKEVLIEIPVTERLPTQCFNTVNSGDSYKVAYFHKEKHPSEQWSDNIQGNRLAFPEVWLEKQIGYFLTKEEMDALREKIISEAFDAARKTEWPENVEPSEINLRFRTYSHDKQSYIQSQIK